MHTESNHVWKDMTRIVLSSGSTNHRYLPAWFRYGHDLEQARAPRVAFYDWLRYTNPREKKAIYRTTITNRAMLPNSGILSKFTTRRAWHDRDHAGESPFSQTKFLNLLNHYSSRRLALLQLSSKLSLLASSNSPKGR
jgi:hypothetical protein